MYYVIFRWASGGNNSEQSAISSNILRNYCWNHDFFLDFTTDRKWYVPLFFNSHAPLNFCHHCASVVRPSTITKKYSPLKSLGHLRPNFGWMVRGWSPSKIVSGSPDFQPTWPLLLKIKEGGMKILKSSCLKLLGQLELNFA